MHTHYPFYFFLTDTSPTEIYTLSLHDALPISAQSAAQCRNDVLIAQEFCEAHQRPPGPAFWNTCVEMIGFTAPSTSCAISFGARIAPRAASKHSIVTQRASRARRS